MAELPQKSAVVLEEETQHPGDGEDDLAVRGIQEELLPHPLAPLFQPFCMARGTETAGAAGEHQEAFSMAVGTADVGEPATGFIRYKVIPLARFWNQRILKECHKYWEPYVALLLCSLLDEKL